MNFKTIKEADDKKYIWLNDVVLEQGLKTLYEVNDKKFLIVDPDKKDYQGKEYTRKVTVEEKEYGIVQEIKSEAIIAISELAKVLRTL